MTGPFNLTKTLATVSDLKEDDRFYIGGIMYKIQSALTQPLGDVTIHMFPVFVDFLPEVSTLILPSYLPIEIYNQ